MESILSSNFFTIVNFDASKVFKNILNQHFWPLKLVQMGSKLVRMPANGLNWLQFGPNGPKLRKMVQNGSKLSNLTIFYFTVFVPASTDLEFQRGRGKV